MREIVQPSFNFTPPTKQASNTLSMANFGPHNRAATTFHLFLDLPSEVRLLIWEHTWPGPRVNHAAGQKRYVGDNDFLLKTGDLLVPSLLQELYGVCYGYNRDSAYNTDIPVALHVCRESRQHTWGKYRLFPNKLCPSRLFCASADRDVLLIADSCGEQHDLPPDPVDYECLLFRNFKTVLVLSDTWKLLTPAQYAKYYLDRLPDIETILMRLDELDIDGEAGYMEVSVLKKGTGRLSTEVAEIKAEYSEFVTGYGGPAKKLLFVDNSGKFY